MTTPTPIQDALEALKPNERYERARQILKDVVGLSWDNQTKSIHMTPDSFVRCIDKALTDKARGEWRDISTAPKDGEWVQLYWPDMSISMYPAIGFNHGDEYGWECVSQSDYGQVFPTHWMPLPPPPVQAEEV